MEGINQIQNGGIEIVEDYTYTTCDNICDSNRKTAHVVIIDGYEDVRSNDEKSLMKARSGCCSSWI